MTYDDSNAPAARLAGFELLRMRGPADMAAMLPYLLGFYPDDSLVAIGLAGPQLQQTGAIRLDIPDDPTLWSAVATDFARLLVELSEQRDRRPDAVLLYLCRDPGPDGPSVVTTLRPLADHLLRAFRGLDVSVKESLCISSGRWWSFLCADPACCSPHGTPVYSSQEPRAVVAAATYAGIAPRGSRRAIAAGLAPIGPPDADVYREALDQQTAMACDRLMADPLGAARAVAATAGLLDEAMAASRAGVLRLHPERSARLIVGLLDKVTRDRAAEYAEPDELAAAQRLWRYLARRCVPPYAEYAKVPLTLLAWTAWLAKDTATARVALGKALGLDPDYTLAALLYDSLNTGLAPEGLLGIVRGERARRAGATDGGKQQADDTSDRPAGNPIEPSEPVAMADGKPAIQGGSDDSPGGGGRGAGGSGTAPGFGGAGHHPHGSERFGGPEAAAAERPESGAGAGAVPRAADGQGGAEVDGGNARRPLASPGAIPRQRGEGEAPPTSLSAAGPRSGGGPLLTVNQARSARGTERLRRLTRRAVRPGGGGSCRMWNGGI
jgi:hypothetical protein